MHAATLNPARVFQWHIAAILCLALGHWLVAIMLRDVPPFSAERVITFFDLDAEASPSTFFTTLSWLAVAGAALLNVDTAPKMRRFWMLVAALAAFLAFDEAVLIHERFGSIGDRITTGSGIFAFSWWVAYPFALAPIAALIVPGLFKLDRTTQVWLFASAAIFCLGAIGFELIASQAFSAYAHAHGLTVGLHADWDAIRAEIARSGADYQRQTGWYVLAEETLEMSAIAIALRTLLTRAARQSAAFRLDLAAVSRA